MLRAAVAVLFVSSLVFAQQPAPPHPPMIAPESSGQPQAAGQEEQVSQINADLGTCTVEFKITNMAGEPIYAARIRTVIKYGIFGSRKTDLEVLTAASGRARFTSMPNSTKKPIVFDITYRGDAAKMTYDPGMNCKAEYTVPLKPGKTAEGK